MTRRIANIKARKLAKPLERLCDSPDCCAFCTHYALVRYEGKPYAFRKLYCSFHALVNLSLKESA